VEFKPRIPKPERPYTDKDLKPCYRGNLQGFDVQDWKREKPRTLTTPAGKKIKI